MMNQALSKGWAFWVKVKLEVVNSDM